MLKIHIAPAGSTLRKFFKQGGFAAPSDSSKDDYSVVLKPIRYIIQQFSFNKVLFKGKLFFCPLIICLITSFPIILISDEYYRLAYNMFLMKK